MKTKITILTALTCVMITTGCGPAANHSVEAGHPGIPVTVTSIHTGPMVNYIELSATSEFLYKAAIKAPATGYVDDNLVNQGDAVKENQTLFTIRTKEAAAIIHDTLSNINFTGIVSVKAATAGLITSIEHPKGDYVAEGDQLCQVAITESFVFILDVPFELSGFIRLHSPCQIILPDSQSIKGIIKTKFPSMSVDSQTERFIVKLAEFKSLPENLTGKIRIVKESVESAISLPKSCILTDETMQQFWVMKLINDSVSVKVPVITGITDGEYVQVIRPVFSPSDLFLASGNYGLGDTISVKVINSILNEK
jgi:biotin carboxyl carrier protein